MPGTDHRGLCIDTRIGELAGQQTSVRLPGHDVIEGTRFLTCRVRAFPDHAFAPLGHELGAPLNESLENFLVVARHEFAESAKESEARIVNVDDEIEEHRFDRSFIRRIEFFEIELGRPLLQRGA